MSQVSVIGGLVSDFVVSVDKFDITPSGWQRAHRYSMDPGGISATALAARKLGVKTSIVGWIGNDSVGKHILSQLNNELIETAAICQNKSGTCVVIALVDRLGRHSRIVCGGEVPIKEMPEVWRVVLRQSSIVFLNGFTCIELPATVVLDLISTIATSSAHLVFDPQNVGGRIERGLLAQVLERTNTLSLSDEDLQSIYPLTDDSNVKHLLSVGISNVLVRRGANGVTIYQSQVTQDIPAFSVPVSNALGAGDTFNGALLFGLSQNLRISDIASIASAMAAIKVSKPGTGGSIPQRVEVIEFLEQHKLSPLVRLLERTVQNDQKG